MTEDLRLVLRDTIRFGRDVMGMTHDEYGGRKGREGGLRETGPHRKMADLLDNPKIRFKMILGPRGCYKSSLVAAFTSRRIVAQPNIRCVYLSSTEEVATDKGRAIRQALESPEVTRRFGSQKGQPWEEDRFTVASRSNRNLQNQTFTAMAMEHIRAGNRADLWLIDDPIDEKNCSSPEAKDKVRRKWEALQPMFADGAEIVVLLTRWDDDDLANDLMESPLFKPPYGQILVFDSGVEIVRRDDGRLDIEPVGDGPPFAHQPIEFLREKFYGMVRKGQTEQFERQYMNRVGGKLSSMFRRQHFRSVQWNSTMQSLTGFLLVDTAVSLKEDGCFTALAYMGIDPSDNLYLLDVRIGHFEPAQIVTQFFDLLSVWSKRVQHHAEVWESIAMNQMFGHVIRSEATRLGVQLNLITVPRAGGDSKRARIARVQGPMEAGKFFVASTVPRTFEDMGEERLLFDPHGHRNGQTGGLEPEGELVNEFLHFKNKNQKVDLADAIATILECDKRTGRRFCSNIPSANDHLTAEGNTDYGTLRPPRRAQVSGSWWDRLIR